MDRWGDHALACGCGGDPDITLFETSSIRPLITEPTLLLFWRKPGLLIPRDPFDDDPPPDPDPSDPANASRRPADVWVPRGPSVPDMYTRLSYQQISILTLNFNTSFVGNLTNVASLEYFTLTVFSFVFVERCFSCLAWVHRTLHVGGSFWTRTHVFLVTTCCSPGSREDSRVLGIVAVWSTAVDIC